MRAASGARRPLSLLVCLLTPLVILMMGVIAALGIVVRASPELRAETGRGLAPPGFQVELPEAGGYTVWWIRDKIDDTLPDATRVLVLDAGSNDPIDLTTLVPISGEVADESHLSMGRLQVTRPTRIDVRISGASIPVTLAVTPVKTGKMLSVVFTVGLIMVITVLVSIVVLFVLLQRRRAVIDEAAGVHSHQPEGPPREED